MASAVQEALEAYVTAHASTDPQETKYSTLMTEHRRLNAERTRLQGQADSFECRGQIDEYNRQLAAFNERVTRFQQAPVTLTCRWASLVDRGLTFPSGRLLEAT